LKVYCAGSKGARIPKLNEEASCHFTCDKRISSGEVCGQAGERNSKVSASNASTLFYQSSTIKRSVIASYWTVILFSIPLWWYTTSIQRLTLPRSRIYFHAQRQLRVPVDICIEDNNVAHKIQNIFEQRIVDNPGYLGDAELRFHVRVDCRQYSIQPVRL